MWCGETILAALERLRQERFVPAYHLRSRMSGWATPTKHSVSSTSRARSATRRSST
jgi:hypothetical protein